MKVLILSVPVILLLTLSTAKSPVGGVFAGKNSTTHNDPTAGRNDTARAFAFLPGNAGRETVDLYDKLRLKMLGMSRESYVMAMEGYRQLKRMGRLHNTNVITIIDYTLSSLHRRLFVLDISKGRLLYNTYVAHGMGSGGEYAKKFSNAPESMQTSLGFYVTLGTYTGKHGLALRLKGVERGINDNALSRGIVLHGAPYVSERYKAQGFMGRSEGCPAIPQHEVTPIIKSIRNGSAVFAYYPSASYIGKSRLFDTGAGNFAKR